jgi:hypothetical protein
MWTTIWLSIRFIMLQGKKGDFLPTYVHDKPYYLPIEVDRRTYYLLLELQVGLPAALYLFGDEYNDKVQMRHEITHHRIISAFGGKR